MKLFVGAITLLLTGQAFAITCSIMTSNLSANCRANIRQHKHEFTRAADRNCQSSGLPKFNKVNAWEDCNSDGTKCKKMQGECWAKSGNPPKPFGGLKPGKGQIPSTNP